MEVITSHLEAEFDSFASMVAAKKLYPRAKLVFSGSQEKSLRTFLRASPQRFGLQRVKSLDFDKIRRLILVDTRRRDRIGPFSAVLARTDVEVHIYDHHPPSPRDITGTVEVIDDVGAAITLMVEQLKKKRISISPEEATLFALGLYEDTGSLTFGSTTPRDLKAGAYLLEQGANLNVVVDYISHEMTADQVLILNDLIRSMKTVKFRGGEAVVATASTDHYVGDLSVITHKLKDMQNLEVLIVAVRMGDRIHLVARSRIEAVDVGEIAYHFGGGGHPAAASATIRSRRLAEVSQEIAKELQRKASPPRRVREMMTAPVRCLEAGATMLDARREQGRSGLHILPVVEGRTFLGLITRPVTEKAIHHGFGEAPVSDYMETEVETVTPGARFRRVEEIMVHQGQRFLPVLERGKIVGAITRTDYLRSLREEAARRPHFGYERKEPHRTAQREDISSLMKERLPEAIRETLEIIGREADREGVQVFLVGGVVRDLLLNGDNFDLDIVVEGDGIPFARRLGKVLGGRVNSHKRFETAVIIVPGRQKIDVATARVEYYASPGAFPTVEHGNIKMDLFRRDFSINALAIQLNPGRFGTLLDFFGGQQDLRDGMIRVLHNLSFAEDPTRVFRAIRFEQRLDFRLGEMTHRLIRDAVTKGFFDHLGGPRLFSELVLILKERNPLTALARMEELGVLPFIHPKVRVSRTVFRLFKTLRRNLADLGEEGDENWVYYLVALSEGLGSKERRDLCERLSVPPRYRRRLDDIRDGGKCAQRGIEDGESLTPGEIHSILSVFSKEAVVYAWSRTTRRAAVAAIATYLKELRGAVTELRGKDLRDMGYLPGPLFRQILADLLKARIDGDVSSRDEEVAWVSRNFPRR